MQVIYRAEAPPGPAASWLIERFVKQADDGDNPLD